MFTTFYSQSSMVVFITKTYTYGKKMFVFLHSKNIYYVPLMCLLVFLGWGNKSEQNRQNTWFHLLPFMVWGDKQ